MTAEATTVGRPEGKSAVGLDLVRGLAALQVVLCHNLAASFVDYSDLPLDQQTLPVGMAMAVLRIAHEAVLIFFVLSGYLVGGQIITRLQEGAFDLQRYGVDRISRIMLPLVPACLLTFGVHAWVSGALPPVGTMLAHVFALNGVTAPTLEVNKPLWSLPYEIWFYILAGALAVFASRRFHLAAVIAILLGLCVFSVLDGRYVFYWALGAAMVFVRAADRKGLYALLGLAAFMVGLVLRQLPLMHLAPAEILPMAVCETIIAVGVALTIPWLASPAANRVLAPLAAPAGMLSAVSYTLYLFHKPVLEALAPAFPRAGQIDAGSIGLFMLRLACVLALVGLAYLLFENNTARVRRWMWSRVQRSRELPREAATRA